MSPVATPPSPPPIAPAPESPDAGVPADELFPGSQLGLDDVSGARYVRWSLGLIGLALVALGAFNAVINPLAAFDHRIAEPAVAPPVTRMKFDLYTNQERDWDLLILGNSRSVKLHPEQLVAKGRTGPGFNGAVFRTEFADQAAWALYAINNPGPDGKPPQIIFTMTLNQLQEPVLSAGLVNTEPLLDQLVKEMPADRGVGKTARQREYDPLPGDIHSAEDFGRVMWSSETTKLSWKQLVRLVSPTNDQRQVDRERRRMKSWPFRPDGYFLDLQSTRAAMKNVRIYRKRLAKFAERNVEAGTAPAPKVGPTANGRELFEHVVSEANKVGITPVVLIMPLNPDSQPFVDTPQRRAIVRAMHDYLGSVQESHQLEWHDYSYVKFTDPDGPHKAWLDHIHPTSITTRRILDRLARDSEVLEPRKEASS